jgi:peptidoglycan/LPS O-acetylase OafA/YrhL
MTERPRLEVLDGLRFVAAMMVVAYHFTAMQHVWGGRRPVNDIFPHQPAAYGWLGVYLFFLISGFVICMSSWGRGVEAFWVSRAVRLYPAYWLSVVVVAVVLTIWPYIDRPVGWRNTLVNLTMVQQPLHVPDVAEVYWTLWAELRFYLLFTLVVWSGLTYRRVVTFCLAWLGAVAAAKVMLPGGIVHTVLMTNYAPLFIAGIAFYLMHRFRPTLLLWGIAAASFLLSLPAVLYRVGLEADAYNPHPQSVAGGAAARRLLRAARRGLARLAALGAGTLAGRPGRHDVPVLPAAPRHRRDHPLRVAAPGAGSAPGGGGDRGDGPARLAGVPVCRAAGGAAHETRTAGDVGHRSAALPGRDAPYRHQLPASSAGRLGGPTLWPAAVRRASGGRLSPSPVKKAGCWVSRCRSTRSPRSGRAGH